MNDQENVDITLIFLAMQNLVLNLESHWIRKNILAVKVQSF